MHHLHFVLSALRGRIPIMKSQPIDSSNINREPIRIGFKRIWHVIFQCEPTTPTAAIGQFEFHKLSFCQRSNSRRVPIRRKISGRSHGCKINSGNNPQQHVECQDKPPNNGQQQHQEGTRRRQDCAKQKPPTGNDATEFGR